VSIHLLARLAALYVFLSVFHHSAAQPGEAAFCWLDEEGEGRFQVAAFRRELRLERAPERALVHLFADSRYHLLVNGHLVNFGPARFYPDRPSYDSHDIAPYLRAGDNVIAVRVVSNGTSTFQLRRNLPGFIAWGRVAGHDLATPGQWRARRLRGYDEQAIRLTFATGPMEVYDARLDGELLGWEQAGHDAAQWPRAARLRRQDAWGALRAREIPQLTQEIYRPRQLLGHYALADEEEIHAFRIKTPDASNEAFRRAYVLIGHTYIHSPHAQEVEVGLWRGEYFLNGEGPLLLEEAGVERPHRLRAVLRLRAGWNEFFARAGSFWGKWDFFMALPRSAELRLSPQRRLDDPAFFRGAGPFSPEEEAWIKSQPAGELPEGLSAAWRAHHREPSGHTPNPAVEMAWRYFGERREHPAWQVDSITIEPGPGDALVYDFRYKKLGRIIVEYEAPAGTIIDAGFTEDLLGPMANVMKRNGLYMAARHIAAGGAGRFETLKPYGLRYLQINVRGNTGPAMIKSVRVAQQIYPFERAGAFECSDPLFNALWEMGWRTLRVCAEDAYTDTPFRERGLYAGDMLPQMGVTLAGSDDLRLIKYSLRLFQGMYADLFHAGAPRHPDEIALLEDYPLLTLEALNWYVDYTADTAFAAELYPRYDYLIGQALARRGANGLVFNQRVFIEWTQLRKTEVENTAYQAILARCCMLMRRLAERLDRPDDARRYAGRFEELRRAINEQLWDAEMQRFHDGRAEGRPIAHHYPISSAWPFLAGITTPAQDSAIFPFIAETLRDIGSRQRAGLATPYGAFYMLGALYERGMAGVAERFMRDYWSPMVYRHEDTIWENFSDEGIGTLSHAWSAAPTYYLSTRVLGVSLGWPRPIDRNRLLIAPQAESVDWARGTVPHPRGPVRVAWEARGELLWMSVEAPPGLPYEVRPQGRLAKKILYVNGRRYDEY
jgi:alpha-L-rhamnosidase